MPEHSRMNDKSKSRCILMSTRRRPLSPRMGDKGDERNKDHLPDIPRCLCVDSQHRVPVSPQSADLQRGVVHTFQQRPYLCFRGSDIRVRRRFQGQEPEILQSAAQKVWDPDKNAKTIRWCGWCEHGEAIRRRRRERSTPAARGARGEGAIRS
jgi:hypothetical protein